MNPFLALGLLLITTASALGSPATEAGDAAYKDRKNEAQARLALEKYREAFRAEASQGDAGWRLSMACYFVGLRLTPSDDEKTALFAEGREAARKALEQNPECPECHFWLAINMALYGQEVGVFKMLFTLKEIRSHLLESIRLNPHYASAGGYRLLGAIEQKLPGILGGSNEEAKRYFQEAIRNAPDEPLNYLFLARLMDEDLGEHAEALKIAEKGKEIDSIPPERLESQEAREELKSWVEAGKARYAYSEKNTTKPSQDKIHH